MSTCSSALPSCTAASAVPTRETPSPVAPHSRASRAPPSPRLRGEGQGEERTPNPPLAMFFSFFAELREAKVPVSLREYLTLMEAMERRVAAFDVEEFYFLARASLVKDERHL